MRAIYIALFVVCMVAPVRAAVAMDRSVIYRSQYNLSGFLLRAAFVCQGNRHDVSIAFALLDRDELKAFSRAYPKTTKKWMEGGAERFNSMVMKDGIPSACNYALRVLNKAKKAVKERR